MKALAKRKKAAPANNNRHRGSDFRDFLAEEGLLHEVAALALKRVVALQITRLIENQHITKTELAGRMGTSRASVDRLLDPENPSLTIGSLGKAAAALGRKVELRLVPA
jgi:predicted XRE-type DNA-binding protein